MKIINFIYKKIFFFISITFFSSIILFYIFSLISNLNESYNFITINFLSILNSLIIIGNVPGLIFIISVFLFVYSINSRNELMIIMSNFKKFNLVMVLIPISILFTLIDINKNNFVDKISKIKLNLESTNNSAINRLLIEKEGNKKNFYYFKNIDAKSLKFDEYLMYQVNNLKILTGVYGTKLSFENENISINDFTKYENNEFNEKTIESIELKINLNKLLQNKNIINNYKYKDGNIFQSYNEIYNFILKFLLYLIIILTFLNKNLLIKNKKYLFPLVFSFIIFSYSLINLNYDLKFSIISDLLNIIIFTLLFIKIFKYE